MKNGDNNTMKTFITGGAGFLGINLVRYLRSHGFREIVSYDIAPFDYPEKDSITVIDGDIRDAELLSESVRGCDVVVHAAAALPLYKKKDIVTTDIDGTRNVLEASFAAGVSRFVMISSTAVYGIPDHHPLYEEEELDGVGAYGKAKIAAEELCESYRDRGMCVPVIRPKSFVGPERLGVFALLYDWANDGRSFPMIGRGDNRYQLLDVEDLCEAIRLCMTLPDERVNMTFNIGAGEFAAMREDYQAVLDEAGFGKRIIGFPAWPVIFTLRILEFFHLSPLYKWVYETASKDSYVSIDRAKRYLGFSPKYSNRDALLRNFRWYLDNLDSFKERSGISHRVPWKQGIIKLFKAFF